MLRQTLEVNTGYSKKSLSGSEVVLAVLGNKNATRSVGRTFSAPNKRKHIRNQNIWMCYCCAGVETPTEKAKREESERVAKKLAVELKLQEDAEKKILKDVKTIADLRRIASNYDAYWVTALFQLPLYCMFIYIPIVPMRMKTAGGTCFYVSLFYYAVTIITVAAFKRDGIRWEIVILALMYSFLEYLVYSSAAKKGRQIPPPLPTTENL
jgi:hypothetical protein